MRETAKNEILAQQEAQEKAERLALAKAKPKEPERAKSPPREVPDAWDCSSDEDA